MMSSFGIKHSLFLRSLSISVVWLCVHCWSWFEAHERCRSKGDTIGARSDSNNSYWTIYFKRRSHWMTSLGCASNNFFKNCEKIDMIVPSAGLCQELCIERLNNLTFFVVQNKTCICLSNLPMDLTINHCSPDSINDIKSAAEDNKCNVCGEITGSSASFVFLSHHEDTLLNSTCITVNYSITKKCLENDQCVIEDYKNVLLELSSINGVERHENTCTQIQSIMDRISYPTTNQLSNLNMLVLTRQIYTSFDRESVNFTGFEKTNTVVSCQLCSSQGCKFTDCKGETGAIFCSKGTLISNLTQEQTSVTLHPFREKEDETIKNLGIVATSLVIFILSVGVVLYIIREKTLLFKRESPCATPAESVGERNEQTSEQYHHHQKNNKSYFSNMPNECLYEAVDPRNSEKETSRNQENHELNDHLRDSVPKISDTHMYSIAGYKTSDKESVYLDRMCDPYDHLRGSFRKPHIKNDPYMMEGYAGKDEENIYSARMGDSYDHLRRTDRTKHDDSTYDYALSNDSCVAKIIN